LVTTYPIGIAPTIGYPTGQMHVARKAAGNLHVPASIAEDHSQERGYPPKRPPGPENPWENTRST